jgi:UDP-glucuronate decarboxylase
MIDGLARMMDTDVGYTGPVNLGNPAEFTMLELAERITALTGSKSKIVFAPSPADDPRQRQPRIDEARHALGWEPKTPLDEGLARTIAYFKELLAA